jgi:hypothetical protein
MIRIADGVATITAESNKLVMRRFVEFRSKLTTAGSMLQPLYVISPSCSVWNYKIPTRAADFVVLDHIAQE